jgi:uncharacterized protein YndB with AHSA1/START domain
VIHYSSEVSINRSPRDVFAALLDAKMYERWTEMTETSFDAPGRPTVGTRGRFRMPNGPLKGTFAMEVTELEPDARLVIRVTSPKVIWMSETTLVPDGSGTRVTYAGTIEPLGLLRLMEPVMAGEVKRSEANEIERFKALLEAEEATRPAAVGPSR